MTIIAVLGLIADKIIDALLTAGLEKVVEETWGKLKGNESKNAFKLALGEAMEAYANATTESKSVKIIRYVITQPFFKENGFLTEKVVIDELAHILRFDREPDYQLIGDRWKASIARPAIQDRIDFTMEAKKLVECLQIEMEKIEVFIPIFQSKSLNAINSNVAIAVESLANIEEKLVGLNETMNTQLMVLIEAWVNTYPSIQDQIHNFTGNIQVWSDDFIGRHFVFEKIEQFMRENPKGYFLIKALPGIGKTALMAEWIKTQGSIHHFNIRAEHINTTDIFLNNVCAQLIATYNLAYDILPPNTTQSSGVLFGLLNEISKKLKPEERVVIAVDALDEVDEVGSANLLYLPKNLPQGIYVIATARPETDLHLSISIDCELEEWLIEHNSDDNLNDVRQFVGKRVEREGVQAYIHAQKMGREEFVKYMTEEKSEGNFMYLRHVLRDIEKGIYKDRDFSKLPKGLKNYYEDHWKLMKKQADDFWFEYKIPVLVALSIVEEPVAIEQIADFSRVKDYRRINSVLNEWRQFIYVQTAEYEGRSQKRYRLYHDSFREFIASKDEVEGEYIDLKKAHGLIATAILDRLHGNK